MFADPFLIIRKNIECGGFYSFSDKFDGIRLPRPPMIVTNFIAKYYFQELKLTRLLIFTKVLHNILQLKKQNLYEWQ